MNHRIRTRTLTALAALLLAVPFAPSAAQAAEAAHVEDHLPSGAAYLMDMPATRNGTVLLDQGYALIGSSYATNGWAVTDAVSHTLEARIGTGRWAGTTPAVLNTRAAEADPASPARYVPYAPAAYPRPYDRSHPCDGPRR
ncbi:hypothetical protein [Streptomyces sp. 4N124]|uniref:hypothetical protein n=1 Tax=Streptomyces sp. 4N124 TaxID=3457420 RepID=UPI003FCFD729